MFLRHAVTDAFEALYKVLFEHLFYPVYLRPDGGVVDIRIFPDIMPEHVKIDDLVDVGGKEFDDLGLSVCQRLLLTVKKQPFALQIVAVHLADIDDAFGSNVGHFEQTFY